ncbi:MAG: molybdopterin-dependent oxidoreductase [Halieaceae bacterium]|nr:molybdopterin-dependent oxidoreductase [Halieaceae bacterium]
MSEFKTIGKNEQRVDIRSKVLGTAVYAADVNLPDMLHGKVVRCYEHAHARVVSLDLSAAAAVPGVVKVLGPKDVTSKAFNKSVIDLMASESTAQMLGDIEEQHIFTDHVKFYGDGIAGIIATSEEAAEQAAALVAVEYEPLPVYLTPEASAAPDAVQFTDQKPGNLAFSLPDGMFPGGQLGWGEVDQAFEGADLVIEDTFYTPKQKQCQMEPNSYVALYDDEGRLNCWMSSQMPKLVHEKLARLFEMPMSQVKVTQTVVGGGFGARLGMVMEPEVCAMALAVPGRPVKLQQPREEDWLTSPSRHPSRYWMKLGFKKDGTPAACDARSTNFKGGYYLDGSALASTTGFWLQGMYRFDTLRYKGDSYFTNQPVCGAFRGYGNPQTNFVLEQMIDRGCAELNIDPLEWRKKWHKQVGDMSWLNATPYTSCALDECLDQGAEAIGWAEKRAKYASQTGTKRRGIGVSVGNHTSGAFPMILEQTTCTVRLNEDASATVLVACSEIGQGSHTTLRQIAAETLGLPLDDVRLDAGDSDANGFDIGAHASRTLYVGGTAVMKACEDAREQLFARAAKLLQTSIDELDIDENKQIFVKDSPDRFVSAAKICRDGSFNFANPQTGELEGEPGQIQAYVSYKPDNNSPPFFSTFVEVEVDTETGEVDVLELVSSHDIGRAIHPAICEGQMEGGAQQGLGMALMEEIYFDDNGHVTNNSFTDYKMLGASDMPKMTNILVENPDPYGPFGAKSVGEAGLVTPVGATANAIFQATGIQFTQGPITPEKILQAIKEKGLSYT